MIRQFLRSSWWVLLFGAFSYLLYHHAMQKKRAFHQELSQSIEQLKQEKEQVTQQRDDLLSQIESQKDPAWIEMVLMQKLGLVPEGQVKVYFKESPAGVSFGPESAIQDKE